MTEAEWLASDDPAAMLEWRRFGRPDGIPAWIEPASDRKLRLFACAGCRLVWPKLTGPRSRHAVLVAERFADGTATADELSQSYVGEVACCVGERADWCAGNAIGGNATSRAAQAALLRCLFGNPWRPVTLPKCGRCDGGGERIGADRPFEFAPNAIEALRCPDCRGAGSPAITPDVRALARAAYDERAAEGLLDPVRLLVLADALEEAGCDNPDLLGHLRGPGPHARGCWALDLLLGKE